MAEKNMIEFQTRLGLQKIAFDRVIRFPKGLIGYEEKHDFALLQIREEVPFLVLQSLEDPQFGLMVADPYNFIEDFSITLSDIEQHMLHVDSPGQVSILVTVNIPPGNPEETCLNLSGPIVINHESRIGLQIPLVESSKPNKVYLNKKNSSVENK